MGRKFILLIEDIRLGSVCYRGEGTEEQIKEDIKVLLRKGIEPRDLEIIPIVGPRIHFKDIILGASAVSLVIIGKYCYENIYKRTRKRRRECTSS